MLKSGDGAAWKTLCGACRRDNRARGGGRIGDPNPSTLSARRPGCTESKLVERVVDDAHSVFQPNQDEANLEVFTALARAILGLFGICVVGTDGYVYAAGEAITNSLFMSISKPFVFALVCDSVALRRRWIASATA
jgi:hypothetical protein